MPKICQNCGADISDKLKFCELCGAKIDPSSVKIDERSKLEENKESAEFWYDKGVDFTESHEYEEALQAYNKALTFDSEDPDIWINKCYILNKLGNYDEAVLAGNEGVKLSPQDPDIWDNLCDAYTGLNNKVKADECRRNISKLEENRESAEFWYDKGVDFTESHEYEEALQAYNKALTFDSEDPDIWINKCYILNKLGNYDEAVLAGNEGVKLSPHDRDMWDNLCDAYTGCNNKVKADECRRNISKFAL